MHSKICNSIFLETLKEIETNSTELIKQNKSLYNGIAGIYAVVNSNKKRVYIGQTFSLSKRKREHFFSLEKNDHHNRFIQNDWNQSNTKEDFRFLVLETIVKGQNISVKKVLTMLEQKYIDKFFEWENCYNLCPVAGTCLGIKRSKMFSENISKRMAGSNHPFWGRKGEDCPNWGKKHSDKTKAKISKSKKGRALKTETKVKISNALMGRTFSEKHKEKIRKNTTGINNPMWNKHHTKEHKEKMSKLMCMPIVATNKITNMEIRFKSIKEAAKILNLSRGTISKCLSGIRKSSGGFVFKKQ